MKSKLENTTLVLFIICLDTEFWYLMLSFSRNLIVGLHWVQSVIKKWWPELSANGNTLKESFSEDKYALAMHFWYTCLLFCFAKPIYSPGEKDLYDNLLLLSLLSYHCRNLQAMRQQLKECWEDGTQLSSVPGTTGEIAKVDCCSFMLQIICLILACLCRFISHPLSPSLIFSIFIYRP